MKKVFLICTLVVLQLVLPIGALAQNSGKKYAVYCVAFYNQENLFDTIHDAHKNDYEFLPNGGYHWTGLKYKNKLKNMATVLADFKDKMAPAGPAFIGLSEVENRRVLEDLRNQEQLKPFGYEIIHEEGEDKRGVDCAAFYNPQLFKYKSHKLVPFIYEDGDTVHRTRGFLVCRGEIAGEDVAVIVNHWPSRGAKSDRREIAGRQVRHIKDSLLAENPNIKVMIMGDLNDDPMNVSIKEALGAKRKPEQCKAAADLYNPWWDILAGGNGTLKFRDQWNLFDQIIFTGNLLGTDRSTLKFYKAEIFSRDYLFEHEGKFKGYPKRTHGSGIWLNGYSDHLPTRIFLIKEVK